MDLFGTIAYISIGGNKYGLVIIDDFSRFTWVFFLQVLALLSLYELLPKRTETDVTFTREYTWDIESKER